MNDMLPLVTVAKRVNRNPETIRRLIRRGDIPHEKRTGGWYYVRQRDVEQFYAHLEASQAAPCGTYRGYVRHWRRKDDPCPPCLKAKAEYVRARRRPRDAYQQKRRRIQEAARRKMQNYLIESFPDEWEKILWRHKVRAGVHTAQGREEKHRLWLVADGRARRELARIHPVEARIMTERYVTILNEEL